MQVNCQQCHKPFALSVQAVVEALAQMDDEKLHHYNAHCPHCGKPTHLSRPELQRFAPKAAKPIEEKPE